MGTSTLGCDLQEDNAGPQYIQMLEGFFKDQWEMTWRCSLPSSAELAAAMPTADQAPHCRLVHPAPCIPEHCVINCICMNHAALQSILIEEHGPLGDHHTYVATSFFGYKACSLKLKHVAHAMEL